MIEPDRASRHGIPNTAHSLCPVCSSAQVVQIHPGDVASIGQISFTYTFTPANRRTLPAFRCNACSHVFCWPVPANIMEHYVDVVDDEYLRHGRSRMVAASAVLKSIGVFARAGDLLDVGCATGDFLAIARDLGYQTAGIELSHWSASIARERGISVYEESLAAVAQRTPASWDVVTLWGVIEHFTQPAAEMAHLTALLKPGGILALWTGDVASITSRLLGRRWWYWQGQHIQYFSRRSLIRLVEDAGLELLSCRLYPFGATRETIDNSLRRYTFKPILEPFVSLAFKLRPVWYLRLPGEMFLLARRPSGDNSSSAGKRDLA